MLSAAAVPWRYAQRGAVEFAIVRRRRHRDWGFPKGSPLAGESLDSAAMRELREETGIESRHVAPLANLIYAARSGRPKLASYWLVRAGPGTFRPNREIAKLTWATASDARVALTYEREQLVLQLALDALGLTGLAG
jgi:8-oxo-dGTP diphosphatase